MTISKTKLIYLIVTLLIFSCSSDEVIPIPAQEEKTEQEMGEGGEEPNENDLGVLKENLMILLGNTSGNKKVWRISSATLINENGDLVISNNTHVLDDEFIFIGDNLANQFTGTLIWKKRKGLNIHADSSEKVVEDTYFSPIDIAFSIDDDLNITGNGFKLSQVENKEELSGEISLDTATESKLTFSLAPKTPEDYKHIPNSIDFRSFAEFKNIRSYSMSTGFVGSYRNNSLYMSYRDQSVFPQVRRVFRYELSSKVLDSTFISYEGLEFVASRLHLSNNELVVVGSGRASKLPANLSSEPISYEYNLPQNLSRFGTAFVDSQIYSVGGDIAYPADPSPPLRIRKLNLESFDLELFNEVEGNRLNAEGEIVDSSLFVFGGFPEATSDPIWLDTLIEYNLENKTVSTIDLPVGISYTSASRYENLIFVGGRTSMESSRVNFHFGVFNTMANSYSEVPTTFEGLDSVFVNIESMTVLGNTLYVMLVDKRTSTILIQTLDLSVL